MPKRKPPAAAPLSSPPVVPIGPYSDPYPDPYTAKLTGDTLNELTLIARGQKPGQRNHATFAAAEAHKATVAARPKTTPHKRLLNAVSKAIKKEWPTCKIEKRNTGTARFKDQRSGKWRPVHFGQTGEADLRITLGGKSIALEIKAPETGDTQRDSQVRWQAAFERAGGYYAVVHSVEEAMRAVKRGAGVLL